MTYSSISIFNKEPWSSYKEEYGKVKRELLRAFVYGFLFYPSFSMWVTRVYCNWFENSEINSEFVPWFFPSGRKSFPHKY